jgi:pimeloyl-ACP methyl ester carboxylesterase
MLRLAEIRCPTQIIAGAKDEAVPMHHPRMLHQGIRDSTMRVIEGAGHELLFTHSDAFVSAVGQFLDGA